MHAHSTYTHIHTHVHQVYPSTLPVLLKPYPVTPLAPPWLPLAGSFKGFSKSGATHSRDSSSMRFSTTHSRDCKGSSSMRFSRRSSGRRVQIKYK